MKSVKIILCSLLVTSLMSCLGIRLVDASPSEYSRYVGFGGDFVIPGRIWKLCFECLRS